MNKLLDVNKYKYPILAKPSGVTLDMHRQDVIREGAILIESMPFARHKYNNFTGKDLAKRIEVVCHFHDEGKELSRKWQIACQQDYESFLNWQLNNKDKTFREYSLEHDVGANIRRAETRHEFFSLKKNSTLPLVLQVAIAAHHGKLSENFEDRWKKEGFEEFWTRFKKESYKERTLEQIAKMQYEYAGPRGILQLADHRTSAKEEGDFVPEITKFQYHFPFKDKRNVQKLIENRWKDDLLLVRSPTGSGKTDASLLWASKQIENKKADRLIIAMPTRFTSNALAINVAESLSDTGLYHSSAWSTKFQEQVEAGIIEKRKAEKIHEFARLLQTPITVCTIDHLLMALTLTREDHHLITFNLANSCLVIDEADFYDDFTQANILVLLEILKYWDVPVLLMSASLPESILPLYQKVGYKTNQIIEDSSDNFRVRFDIKEIRNYNDLSDIEDLLELCIKKNNAIIYANTVDKAIIIYDWFLKRNVNPILYHSRFTEPDKKDKEQELIDALGKSAWEKNYAKGIAILTQIGEMSINISADLMISELCPIDRLTQRAGRLCRFDRTKIGELYVLIPQKNNSTYSAPYGEYDRRQKKWIPCKAFNKTNEVLEIGSYNADKLVNLLNDVYSSETVFSSKAVSNAQNLKEYFQYNWLINPKHITSIDDSETSFWRSRNIAPQESVYVSEPTSRFFSNYLKYQNWKLNHSLELPIYLIEKAKKQHIIDIETIVINEDKDSIYIIREGFYNKNIGVKFMDGNQQL